MDHFELVSEYAPTGDQPQAIEKLVRGFKEGNQLNKKKKNRHSIILYFYFTV